jgi:tRNA(Arg) A34 adenosine deaminase TadA
MKTYMELALAEAERAAASGEVPVGAVLVDPSGAVVARGHNRVEALGDPTAHAEMNVLQEALRGASLRRLEGYDLYVTLEPCAMCAGAMALTRLRGLFFGAYDPKGGAVEHGPRFFQQASCHHAPEVVGGLQERRCGALLRAFFQERRGAGK